MTLEKLIKKLQRKRNGSSGFLKAWLEDLSTLKSIYECSEYKCSIYDDMLNKYQTIYGFIWGLFATNYITEEEQKSFCRN